MTRLLLLTTVALTLGGCGGARYALNPEEYGHIARGRGAMAIVKYDLQRPDRESVLRQRAMRVKPDDTDLTMLLDRLYATLEKSGGVGLAAPQIGISRRVVLVRHGTRPAGQPTRVVAYLNPRLEHVSAELDDDYEACLSIDGVGALVPRHRRIRVSHVPLGGGPRETVALVDWDARIMQHELDHLDGVLFVDRATGPLLSTDEARRRRNDGHRARGWLPPAPSTSKGVPSSAPAPASAPAIAPSPAGGTATEAPGR